MFKNNECFGKTFYRDNCNFFITNLKPVFKRYGLEISTQDIIPPESSDIILRLGFDEPLYLGNSEKSYLVHLESPPHDLGAMNEKNHKYFKKIFTWNDDIIDNKKYYKINQAHEIPKTIPKIFDNKKLCTIIAGNKSANHPDELYTERVKFIRWIETRYLYDFDLYGTRWDQYRFGHSFAGKVLNKIKPLRKQNLFPSYKGLVVSKYETLKDYKFSICYENIKDQNGYITEKIFDCFFAGCIPIYWGSKNIHHHIPRECYVDKNAFDNFEDMYRFMKNMDKKTYMNYLDNIDEFLNSTKSDPFCAYTFADTIASQIMIDLNNRS
jgi:alpha(1,3/1,4) fucosyltransferase